MSVRGTLEVSRVEEHRQIKIVTRACIFRKKSEQRQGAHSVLVWISG